MVDVSVITGAIADVLTVTNLLYILAGVTIGQLIGATPGLSIVMALAIAIPLTYVLDTLTALAFLISVNKGGTVGGAVPAILLRVPGTPESAATTLDGYPMAQKGQPIKAMKYGLYYSVFGDLSSDLILILVSAPLAIIALRMGPIEILALMTLALTVISALVGSSMVKGLTAAALGFLLASVGSDPGTGTPRFTFGIIELYDGISLTALSIGMLAMSEVMFSIIAARRDAAPMAALDIRAGSREDRTVTFRELMANKYVAIRAMLIGTAIGAIPGLGSTTAGFLSYSITKQMARDPGAFGTGDPRGIAASETANSAVVGANLIPLLTLGIPGNIAAALIVSAFLVHGLQPGPLLFENQAQLVYGMFFAMLIANFFNLAVGQVGMRFWAYIVSAPASIIYPGAVLFCMTGSYAAAGGFFGIYVMIATALLGYLMRSLGYSIVAFIVAFFLEPMLERSFVQTQLLIGSDYWLLLHHPIAIALWGMTLVTIFYLCFVKRPSAEGATYV